MARRYERKTGQRQQSERELTIRAEFHEPPDLDKLCELLIRLALQQSGSCRSDDATRPKRPRTTASTSS
ncbi:MAG TPA: hypothetical protein PLC22_17835 [Gordonia sp. (in: high G+C Gram-positive bacteria)]|nr:hypothetical protein [Gordonia sp. (in: high G+C Gram-positive bacteria)]